MLAALVTLLVFCEGTAMAARPTAGELALATRWARARLLGETTPAETFEGLAVSRNNGPLLRCEGPFGQAITIGQKAFEHGLFVHAVSDITVGLPGPGARFQAQVGVDNNQSTGGERGSVVFVVAAGGRELFRSEVLRGGQAPVPVDVALDGALELVLQVEDGGDGIGWDQCDWADAGVTLEDGTQTYLDEMPLMESQLYDLSPRPPFSFVYDGRPSAELLANWPNTSETTSLDPRRTRIVRTWTCPNTGLQVRAEATLYHDFPAVEWVLHFTNGGTQDTPILENIQALDVRLEREVSNVEFVLRHSRGSQCARTDFELLEEPLPPNSDRRFTPGEGRSSNQWLPFFNVMHQNQGVILALGWTGEWAAAFRRDADRALAVLGGMDLTHLKLHPGESIRTPRVLVLFWHGGPITGPTGRVGAHEPREGSLHGHNLLRSLLLAHYTPRPGGRILQAPCITGSTDLLGYNGTTEENQIEHARLWHANEPGMEYWEMDAGWSGDGGWPSGMGTWTPNPEHFPRGLRPLSDAVHDLGMKLDIWFEPERVCPGTQLHREHPEWLLGGTLLNLGDPAARQYITDLISNALDQWRIDIYRQDCNLPLLPHWRAADPPDRQGITEIRHVEGLYAFWDELVRRKPDLFIDNCASGGRRLDLETTARSMPIWRTDYWNDDIGCQCHTLGLSYWLPLHGGGVGRYTTYSFRSVLSASLAMGYYPGQGTFPWEWARSAVAEYKRVRRFFYGDFYPLTPYSLSPGDWLVSQWDREDLGQGMILGFRRGASIYLAAQLQLHGLQPDARYELTNEDTKEQWTHTGAELMDQGLRVEAREAPSAFLFTYRRL